MLVAVTAGTHMHRRTVAASNRGACWPRWRWDGSPPTSADPRRQAAL